MDTSSPSIVGFLGGTGPEGRGLALRLALAGERVLIGSREESRARDAAESLASLAPSVAISGATNSETARVAHVVFITVPYAAQKPTLVAVKTWLAGKIVVPVVAPLAVRKGVARALQVEEGSAALEAQAVLPDSKVVAAFQTISAHDLLAAEKDIDSDVVVCGDDAEAKGLVMELAEKVRNIRAVDGGGLQNARYVEDLTALLLNINRIYKVRSAIKIVGL